MIPTILLKVGGWVSSYFERKQKEQEAKAQSFARKQEIEAEYDNIALQQMQFTWKDEFLMLVLYSPLIIGWWWPERAKEWVAFIEELPTWYQLMLTGVLVATFGLRWFFNQNKKQVLINGKSN